MSNDIIIIEVRGSKGEFAQHLAILYYKSQQLVEGYKKFNYADISTGRVIGQGSFGVVHLVEYQGQKLAVKEFQTDFKKISEQDAEVALMYFSKHLLKHVTDPPRN